MNCLYNLFPFIAMNIRIPERIQMANLLHSQPSIPIPLPSQYYNGIQSNIGQRSVYQNVQALGPPIAYQSRPMISNNRIQNNYSPQRPIMPINNYSTQNIRTTDNRLNPLGSSQRYPKMRPDLMNMNHEVFNRKIENRPLSPKVQFKYASPPKQNESKRTQQIKQMKRESNQQDKNKNLIYSNKSITKEQNSVNEDQREIKKQDSQIVVNSIENPMGTNRNSINNFIYLLENQAVQPENEQKQQIPILNISNSLKQFKAVEQALPSIKNTLKNSKKQEVLNKQKYLSKETKQQSNNTQKSYELLASKNKTHSQELKQLLTQYERIKISNNHSDFNYNYLVVDQDNQFPRVERNSSEEGQSYPSSKQGSRDTSKKNSILNNNEAQYHGGASFGRLPQDGRNKQKIIFNQAQSSRKLEANNNGIGNLYKLEKQEERKKLIKQQEQFIISGIEGISGIENVKSELIQGRVIEDNRQSQKQDEPQNGLDIRLRQKDLQIKNLKNQIWMMKLRQNQLLNQINKLQQVNRDQGSKLAKLTKI